MGFPLHKPYPYSLYCFLHLHSRYLKCLVIQCNGISWLFTYQCHDQPTLALGRANDKSPPARGILHVQRHWQFCQPPDTPNSWLPKKKQRLVSSDVLFSKKKGAKWPLEKNQKSEIKSSHTWIQAMASILFFVYPLNSQPERHVPLERTSRHQ